MPIANIAAKISLRSRPYHTGVDIKGITSFPDWPTTTDLTESQDRWKIFFKSLKPADIQIDLRHR